MLTLHCYHTRVYEPNMNFLNKSLITIYALVIVILVAGSRVTGKSNGVKVADIVTEAFFNGIANKAASGCPGKGFYTRAAFLEALKFYPEFGTTGSATDAKREVAAFFAHVAHETFDLCNKREDAFGRPSYCDKSNKKYPCGSGAEYYGRGALQIKGNYNYGASGKSIGFDGLKNPDIVAKDNVIAFKTALWFWMKGCHHVIVTGQGFGETIRVIDSGECNDNSPAAASSRVSYYRAFCGQLKVEAGEPLYCNNK